MPTPNMAHYDKVRNMPDNEIKTNEIADNAVNYNKLDVAGRTYRLEYAHNVEDIANSEPVYVIGIASYSGTIKSITFTPDKTCGQGTNYTRLNTVNVGNNVNKDIINGLLNLDTSHPANIAIPFYVIPSAASVVAGDVIVLKKLKVVNGDILATGKFEIIIERTE
jgi:hypothetical protein